MNEPKQPTLRQAGEKCTGTNDSAISGTEQAWIEMAEAAGADATELQGHEFL